jgi:hypothetical protein
MSTETHSRCSEMFAEGDYQQVCGRCYADIVETITENYPYAPPVNAEFRIRVFFGNILYRFGKTAFRLAPRADSLATRVYPQW